ncbi:hypothetical protein NE237_010837 [Protea cynaroides]|uniref:Uncharacterized protein n=1 Tax=Protea cynaroides TaxID=273540 RepID=A0A9Q0L0G9_9MAGN|nr:hypothetical protein NE237_010837 [Protea cynaroides]
MKGYPTEGSPLQAPSDVSLHLLQLLKRVETFSPCSDFSHKHAFKVVFRGIISQAQEPWLSSHIVVFEEGSNEGDFSFSRAMNPNALYWPKWSITNSARGTISSDVANRLLEGIFLLKDAEFFEGQLRKELMKANEKSAIDEGKREERHQQFNFSKYPLDVNMLTDNEEEEEGSPDGQALEGVPQVLQTKEAGGETALALIPVQVEAS